MNQYIERVTELRRAAVEKSRALMAKAETEKRDLNPSELSQADSLDGEIGDLTEKLNDFLDLDIRARNSDTVRGRAGQLIRTDRQSAGGRESREGLAPLDRATRALFDPYFEKRATDTGSQIGPFSSTLDWADVWPALAPKSITAASGIRTIDINETAVNLPAGTALTPAAWSAELGTATAADDLFGVSRIVPVRVERLAIVSHDALETTAFDARRVIVDAMMADIGAMIDQAVFIGAAGGPSGLINLTGRNTVTGGTVSDLTYFVQAAGSAFSANSSIQAWATSPASWTKLATVQIGGSADKRPLLSSDSNTPGGAVAGSILNHPIYVSTTFGTAVCAVGFDPAEVYLVRRNVQNPWADQVGPALELIVDPFTLLASNQVRFLVRSRVALYVPRPASVTVITTIA